MIVKSGSAIGVVPNLGGGAIVGVCPNGEVDRWGVWLTSSAGHLRWRSGSGMRLLDGGTDRWWRGLEAAAGWAQTGAWDVAAFRSWEGPRNEEGRHYDMAAGYLISCCYSADVIRFSNRRPRALRQAPADLSQASAAAWSQATALAILALA